MSHFVVLVIGEDIDDQLEPYAENLEMEEYDADCHCIGKVARADAHKKAVAEYMDINQIRKEYHALPINARTNKKWSEMIEKLSELEKKYFDEHPDKNKSVPTCGFYDGDREDWWEDDVEEGDRYKDDSGCGGTGKYKSRYNSDSKWDWYSIGGRWSGYFRLKKGAKGKLGESGAFHNKAPKGTADIVKKKDIDFEKMINDIKKKRERTWDDCQEKLRNGEQPSTGIFDSFDPSVSKKDFVNKVSGIAPYSILRDGEWISKGEMGWFGYSNDDMTSEEWDKKFFEIVKEESDDALFTIVDCHI